MNVGIIKKRKLLIIIVKNNNIINHNKYQGYIYIYIGMSKELVGHNPMNTSSLESQLSLALY